MTRDVWIFDAVRTPRGRGRKDGALAAVAPVELAAQVLAALPRRMAFDAGRIEDVVLGIATPIGEQGGDLARFAALRAGYGDAVPGLQVHRFCASGLDACGIAAARIAGGQADLLVAGGVESMSRVAMGSDGGPMTGDPQVAASIGYLPQGVAADVLAARERLTRRELDEWAVRSHARAASAWDSGRFASSIVPVSAPDGGVRLARDEHIRRGVDVAGLAKLAPAFASLAEQGYGEIVRARYPDLGPLEHVHHAGNSSGVVDGAAAVLFGSSDARERLGLRPRGRLVATVSVGADPSIMLTGPEPAVARLLARVGLSPGSVDLWEVNEAFASVAVWFTRRFGLDPARVNVNGGAIAMGHPLGASGAMLLGTALDELERRGGGRAVVTLCAAGGQATAALIESVA